MMRQLAALMWKDWREQRALFLALLFGYPVWVLAMRLCLGARHHDLGELPGDKLIYALLCAAALPAAAIASERRRGTLRFLLDAPIPRWKLFFSKIAVTGVLVLALVVLVVQFALTRSGLWWRSFSFPLPWSLGSHPLVATPLVFLLVSGSVLFGSVLARRPLTALPLGAVMAALMLVASCFFYPYYLLIAPHPMWMWTVQIPYWMEVLVRPLGTLVCVWPVYLGYRAFRRLGDRGTTRIVIGSLLLSALLFVGPQVACVAHLAWRYFRLPWQEARVADSRWVPSPGADRDILVFTAGFPGMPLGPSTFRACVLDTRTGKVTPVTLDRLSIQPREAVSPSGRFVACWVGEGFWSETVALGADRLGGGPWEAPGCFAAFDTETGRLLECREPLDLAFEGWEDERMVFVVRDAPDLRLIAWCPQSNACQPVARPAREGTDCWYYRRSGGSRRVFERSGSNGREVAIYDRDTQTWRFESLGPRVEFDAVSWDCRYGTLSVSHPTEGHLTAVELLDLVAGARTPIWTRMADDETHSDSGFSADGRFAWVSVGHTTESPGASAAYVVLHNVETGGRQVVEAPFSAAAYTRWHVSLTPDGSHVVWRTILVTHDGRNMAAFHSQDIVAGGAPRPLVASILDSQYAVCPWRVQNDGLYFVGRGMAIYHIKLDGTGMEQVFPEKRPVTEEELR